MGENEESQMVDQEISRAKEHILAHAADSISFVREAPTVNELRERLRYIVIDNAMGLMDLKNHSPMCSTHFETVVTAILNMELLLFPLATNPATGESFSTFKERVVRSIEHERDGMLKRAADPANREQAILFMTAIRGLRTARAMEEGRHAKKH